MNALSRAIAFALLPCGLCCGAIGRSSVTLVDVHASASLTAAAATSPSAVVCLHRQEAQTGLSDCKEGLVARYVAVDGQTWEQFDLQPANSTCQQIATTLQTLGIRWQI